MNQPERKLCMLLEKVMRPEQARKEVQKLIDAEVYIYEDRDSGIQLDSAFVWSETPQGARFWVNVFTNLYG